MSPAVCPACGSPSTYVRKRDGAICCKTCGHGVKHRGGPEAVQHECPLCRSKQVYLCGVEGAEREGSLRKGGGESGAPSSLSHHTVILYAGGSPR
jgi:hypothetical protein